MSQIVFFSTLSLVSVSSFLSLPGKLSVLICKDKCKNYGGCTSVRFDKKYLHCELILENEINTNSCEQGMRLLKVHKGNKFGCGRNERTINNNRGKVKCVKDGHCESVMKKDESCREAPAKADLDGVLYKQENVSVKSTVHLIELPLTMTPGMKLSVCGAARSEVKLSRFSLTKAPENPSNMLAWFHVNLNWRLRKISFTKGLSTSPYLEGEFPISDHTNFTLTVELTQNETKISADETLLMTIPLIPVIKEFNLNKFNKLHHFEIQKTEKDV